MIYVRTTGKGMIVKFRSVIQNALNMVNVTFIIPAIVNQVGKGDFATKKKSTSVILFVSMVLVML